MKNRKRKGKLPYQEDTMRENIDQFDQVPTQTPVSPSVQG